MRHLLRLGPLFLRSSHAKPPSLGLSSAAAAIVVENGASPSADPLVSQANRVIPRLCNSDNLSDAVRLMAAALSATAQPPPSFSVLADHLTSHPSMADSMALINRLKYSPSGQPSLLPVAGALIDAYLKKQRPKEAVKLLQWMLRPDSVCAPDRHSFRVLVSGLFGCRAGLEALRALREMLRAGFGPDPDLRAAVYGGLLRLAMVKEAVALDAALECAVGSDGGQGQGFDQALDLLDDIISKWED